MGMGHQSYLIALDSVQVFFIKYLISKKYAKSLFYDWTIYQLGSAQLSNFMVSSTPKKQQA